MSIQVVFATAALSVAAVPAPAAETITYAYDAKGRLIRVDRSGGPRSGAATTYGHDRAGNRTVRQTTGAP